MKDIANICTGLVSMALGAALILWIIPRQTVPAIFASVPSGFYPNFTSGLLILSGFALAVSGFVAKSPKGMETPFGLIALRFAVALVLLVGAMLATPVLGFWPTGIVICLVTLLLMHERRWPLIAAICAIAPLAVWAGFEFLLGRPLP